MEGLTPFATALAIVAIAELGDKTQLMAISLSAQHPAVPVITGVIAGEVAVTALGVAVGALLSNVLEPTAIEVIAALVFLGFGLWSLRRPREEPRELPVPRNVWLTAAGLAFLAELGDKTQFAIIALAATLAAPWSVFAGATVALAAIAATSVALGRLLRQVVRREWIRIVAAALFLAAGVLFLVDALFLP